MGLRDIAANDLTDILEDLGGWSWPLTLTDPLGLSKTINGFSNDISQVIDPDTGLVVTGRSASIAISKTTLINAGFSDVPEGIVDTSKKPWLVEFADNIGKSNKFKIVETAPDNTLGCIVCLLSIYKT